MLAKELAMPKLPTMLAAALCLTLAACSASQSAKAVATADAAIVQINALKTATEQAKAEAEAAGQDVARHEKALADLNKALAVAEETRRIAIATAPVGDSPWSPENLAKIITGVGIAALSTYLGRRYGIATGIETGARTVVHSIDAARGKDPALDAAFENLNGDAKFAAHQELNDLPAARNIVVNTP